MKINVLSREIANMIAAGEVVERPASVVKELAENSIDAGADSITIEIKKGGVPYIRITDNGCGIASGELETAFLRHATSKISSASDLDSIGTLGFRGEALASIAAVSRVEVFSKTADCPMGAVITVEGGQIKDRDDAGCPDGTTMIVRNLFYNTPARMKFLKNDSTETAYVTEVVNRLVLSHPEIAIHYINNGKTVLKSSGSGELKDSIYTVFGGDYTRNMTYVSYEEGSFRVTGFVGNSRIARKDRRHQIFFVNSRNIISRIMGAAVSEAYKNTVMTGRFPVCVLKAEVDPKTVDVNVHPAKTEVRFSDEKQVYNMIYWAVKNALTDKKYIPEAELTSKGQTLSSVRMPIKNAPSYEDARQMEINLLKDSYIDTPPRQDTAKKTSCGTQIQIPAQDDAKKNISDAEPDRTYDASSPFMPTPPQGEGDISRFSREVDIDGNVLEKKLHQNPAKVTYLTKEQSEKWDSKETITLREGIDFRLIGQVFNTYILVQKDEEMLIIDQHAAHERLCFEELLQEFRESRVCPQMMLLPVTVSLSATELAVFEQRGDFFLQLGFEIDVFGTDTVIVRATPGMIEEQDIKDLVSDMISLIIKNDMQIERSLCEDALYMIACKRALKGKSALTDMEMKTLCERVLSLGDGINTCPHGRPITVRMTKYNMEKQFKRIL